MIFYLLGILGYYKAMRKPVPAGICLAFFAVVTVPPTITLFLLLNQHWIFRLIAFAGGIFCWTFFEYCIHRFLMHRKTNDHYHKSMHFHHHTHPDSILFGNARRILVAILTATLTLCGVVFSNYLLLPAGMLTGFSLYSFMHMWLHQSWASRWLSNLQAFHIQHHCGHPETCFGISSTWWDRIFNTVPASVKNISEKTRSFYFAKHCHG